MVKRDETDIEEVFSPDLSMFAIWFTIHSPQTISSSKNHQNDDLGAKIERVVCVHNPQWTKCQTYSDPNVGMFFCCCKTIGPNGDASIALHSGYDLLEMTPML